MTKQSHRDAKPNFIQSFAVDNIKRLSAEGVSQRQIAARTGLKKSTINDILHGRYGVSTERAVTVMTALTQKPYGAYMIQSDGLSYLIVPADKRSFSLMGQYHNAIAHYSQTGDTRPLMKLDGKTIKLQGHTTIKLKVNLEGIDSFLQAGVPDDYHPVNSRAETVEVIPT